MDTEEGMTLDTLDGFLHAIAIGPEFIHPHQWLPKVWGTADGETPAMPSVEVFNRVLQLLMRHYNGIVSGYAGAAAGTVPGVGCPHNGLRRI